MICCQIAFFRRKAALTFLEKQKKSFFLKNTFYFVLWYKARLTPEKSDFVKSKKELKK
jgi:hypothetical protein